MPSTSPIFTSEIDAELHAAERRYKEALQELKEAGRDLTDAKAKKKCDREARHEFVDGGGGGPMGGRFIEVCKHCKYENHV